MSVSLKGKHTIQGIIAFVFFVAVLWLGSVLIDTENVQGKVAAAGAFGELVFILLKSSTIIFAPLGGNPIYLVGESMFGFQKAFVLLFIGDMIGYTAVFWLGKRYGRKIMEWLLSSEQLQIVNEKMAKIATWKTFAVTRILFLGLSDAVSYAVALTPLPFWQYLIITLIAVVVNILILMLVGTLLVTSSLSYVILIIVMTIAPFAVYWFRKKKKNPVT